MADSAILRAKDLKFSPKVLKKNFKNRFEKNVKQKNFKKYFSKKYINFNSSLDTSWHTCIRGFVHIDAS